MSHESAALIRTYNDHQRLRCLSHNTVYRSFVVLRSFASNYEANVLDATRHDIESWVGSTPTTAKTRYTYLSHVATFYRWAVREGLAECDPTLSIVRPRCPRGVPRPIASHDLRFALDVAPPRMRAWLALGAFSGLRCAEIAALTRDDLRLEEQTPVLIVTRGKGQRDRVVPMHAEVLAALRCYGLPRSGHIFLRPGTKDPIAASTVSRYTAVYLRNLGIDNTMHQARHWFGTNVYRRSHDLLLTQQLMGHASPTTTAIYVALANGKARRAVDALAP